MRINKNLKKIAASYPSLSLLGYNVLKKFWNIEANFINYEYPKSVELATITKDKVLDYNKNRPFGPKKRICYAPFNNLHFQLNGDVCSCSFNYDFNLGNVHETNIREIWFGEKAENFRNTLANFNLDKCITCKNVLESGNYSSFPPLKYDIHSDDKAKYPTQMSFEMSNLCNYECIMCNEDFSSLIRKSKNLPPLKYSYPEDFVEQLKEFIPHLSIATFIGGEPLLIKPYFKMWEEIIKTNPGCTIHIQTNGSVLTDKFLEMLESGQFEIGVSVDAPTKETFEKIRIRSNFDEVERNLLKLNEYVKSGKIYMNINFCPLTENWKEIPQMIEYANKLDVVLKIVNVQYPTHLALQHRNSVYLKNVYDTLNLYRFEEQGSSVVVNKNIRAYNDYVKQLFFYYQESLNWEAFLKEHERMSINTLTDILCGQVQSIKNFQVFTDEEKAYLFKEMCNYIFSKDGNEMIKKNIFIRVIYSFKNTEHEGDSITGKNMDVGISVFKRIIDGCYMLEVELQSNDLQFSHS